MKKKGIIFVSLIAFMFLVSILAKTARCEDQEESTKERSRGKKTFMAAIQPVEKTFPAGLNETWKAVMQAIASIGESTATADKESGVISTIQKSVGGGGGYGISKHQEHTLSVVVNTVSDKQTKVSIRCNVKGFRTFIFGHRESDDPSDGSVEEKLIKSISSFIKVEPEEGLIIEKVEWKRGDPLPTRN